MGRKSNLFKKFLKLCVVVICTTGFLLQTAEFMFLYWTYPTVVDIQVSIPSEIELPGISFCNSNGIYPPAICSLKGACSQPRMFAFINLCVAFPLFCENGSLPKDFRAITYHKFMREHELNASTLAVIRKPMSEFFTCKILSEGQEKNCRSTLYYIYGTYCLRRFRMAVNAVRMSAAIFVPTDFGTKSLDDAVLGSYYSEGFMPNFCFSINTLWSQPDKEIKRIKKSERIHLQFYMDSVDRNKSAPADMVQRPRYNYPSNPTIQLAIHSPYNIPSPYLAGQTFMGGKRYEIKLKQDEKHLLPPPYQTNCTDYMSLWKERGGIGPINQIMVIQECKYNASLEKLGCVPLSVDYPHDDRICKLCEEDCNRTKGIWDHCTELLSSYNQPCDSINYNMYVEEKLVYLEKIFSSPFIRKPEKAIFQSLGYNCSEEQILTRRCQVVNIELVFDDFEITNVTYNPKFESLEIFSVIGGYMGMYLGISIVAVYDFAEMAAGAVYNLLKKKKRKAGHRRRQKLSDEEAFKKRRKFVLPFDENGDFRRRRTAIYSYGDKY